MTPKLPEINVDTWIEQHQAKDLLRLLTCGSVDDGKSTLIGRLLQDTNQVYEDHLEALRRDSKKHGTTGVDNLDLALLTDGLKAEREQGITIDVAYRYFTTPKRKFIIADCPGHEQYTRNMATGASTCNLAIILIDARHGVLPQTCRHSFIVSLLGIRHVVVAINKMDLVDYDEAVFERIRADYTAFAAKLDLPDVHFVPLSALAGDNVVHPTKHMPWYQGGPLLEYLESVHIASDRNLVDFRMPVQLVQRPHLDFRGFCGTVASGVVRPGDAIVVLPSGATTSVSQVLGPGGHPLDQGVAGQAVTLTFADEVDCSRGDVLAHPGNRPTVAGSLDAMLVWMHADALQVGKAGKQGKEYLLRHSTGSIPARVDEVRYRVDVNTLHRSAEASVGLNDIARVSITLSRPLVGENYRSNRLLGSAVLVDRSSNATVGALMIRAAIPAEATATAAKTESGVIERDRQKMRGHRGAVIHLAVSVDLYHAEAALVAHGYHAIACTDSAFAHELQAAGLIVLLAAVETSAAVSSIEDLLAVVKSV